MDDGDRVTPIERPARFVSPSMRHWIARQRCAGCGTAPCEPSHYPSRGAGGDDLGMAPLCRKCHDRAQRYEAPFTHEWQSTASLTALRDFIRTADEFEWSAFSAERQRFRDAQPYARMPR